MILGLLIIIGIIFVGGIVLGIANIVSGGKYPPARTKDRKENDHEKEAESTHMDFFGGYADAGGDGRGLYRL